jgi:hypothetical protein
LRRRDIKPGLRRCLAWKNLHAGFGRHCIRLNDQFDQSGADAMNGL